MDRSKLIAIVTGAISLLLAVGYLALVQLLDFRGEMVPAPLSSLPLLLAWLDGLSRCQGGFMDLEAALAQTQTLPLVHLISAAQSIS